MKKALLIVAVLVVLVLIGAFVFVGSNLGRIVKSAIETFGPKVTQTSVAVASVDLSPRSGSGSVKGFVIGNPSPYKEPFAIRLGEAALTVDPASLLTDKIVVKSVRVADPEITIEGGLTDNNLKKLLANIDSFTATEKSKPAEETGAKKKLQVDEFVLSGAKVNVKLSIPGVTGEVPPLILPEIRLTNLGTGPDGITSAELTKLVVGEVVAKVLPAVAAHAGGLSKGTMDKATKGLDGIFKKK